MHESSLITDLLRQVDTVARTHRATRVVGVTITLGALAPVSAVHLQAHFELAARGTIADGAQIHVERLIDDEDGARAQGVFLENVEINGP